MRWGAFSAATAAVVVMMMFQWPKLKQKPRKDKWVFFVLLFMGWMVSMFDLPHIPGPAALLEALFKPMRQFMESK